MYVCSSRSSCFCLAICRGPVCLVRLTWIVFVMGGRWPYSWCLVGCCRHSHISSLLRPELFGYGFEPLVHFHRWFVYDSDGFCRTRYTFFFFFYNHITGILPGNFLKFSNHSFPSPWLVSLSRVVNPVCPTI